MDDLSRADGGQISIALVADDDLVRTDPLDAGSSSGRTPVKGERKIDIEKILEHSAAAHISNTNGIFGNAHLIYGFCQQPVDNSVAAARTVCEYFIIKTSRSSKCLLFHEVPSNLPYY